MGRLPACSLLLRPESLIKISTALDLMRLVEEGVVLRNQSLLGLMPFSRN